MYRDNKCNGVPFCVPLLLSIDFIMKSLEIRCRLFVPHHPEENLIPSNIRVVKEKVVVELIEFPVPNINSSGGELVSKDDWIKAHVKRYGKESKLFDGI